jgi:hypothetical protein
MEAAVLSPIHLEWKSVEIEHGLGCDVAGSFSSGLIEAEHGLGGR